MNGTMKAVVALGPGVDDLRDIDLPLPMPGPHDLVVEVRAVSVNPVDYKQRSRIVLGDEPRVLGFDAAGIVRQVGAEVTLFSPGDEVWYAGDIKRPGTNSAYHVVDERIVGVKPNSLGFAEAASLPLTAITAWEALFDRLGVTPGERGTVLIVGGAGGVGSIMIQLARALTELTVIATASRPETREWATKMGAQHVIDHTQPLAEQVKQIFSGGVDLAFSAYTQGREADLADALRPQGRLGLIDSPEPFDLLAFKPKSISVHWEFMFTRPSFATPDMVAQHELLNNVAALVDTGRVRHTMVQKLVGINADTVRQAHEIVASAKMIGKIVISRD